MRHKVFCSKTKSALLLTVIAAIITSVVLATATSMHDAHAAGSEGSATTARQKLWYQAISYCMTTSNGEAWKESGYSNGSSYTYYLKKSEYESLNWFDSGFRTPSYSTGAYIENLSRGKYDQGGIWCGEFDNAIVRKGLESLGLTGKLAELACAADSINGGIFAKPNNGSCVDSYNNDNLPKLNTDLSQMSKRFEEVVKEVTFGGNVPKGDLNTFTDTEKYYLYQDAFNAACNGGGPHFGSDNSSEYMQVLTLNSSTGKYEMAGYSLKSGRSKTSSIVVYNGHKLTCQQLADEISDTNGAAFKGNVQNDKDSCDKKFSEEYDKVKDWYNKNASNLDATAQADINDILSKYNPSTYNGGKGAWTLESDGINIKCRGLEDLSQEWSVTKGRDSLADAPSVDSTFTTGASDANTGSDNGTTPTCHTAAKALGWILCPVLELSASATQGIYENYIEPSLVINHTLFDPDDSISGTHDAWAIFRDIANIVFVILMLVVIFSQVTGIGIDNYGIKKILPKLIIAAILVNLSFFICQFVIDLSNIVGSGVYNTFNNIKIEVSPKFIEANGLGTGGYTGSIITTVAIAIGGAAIWGVVAGGAAVAGFFLSLVPAILGALVSVLFLFVLLAMRQALVVILVVLSPLAFVCYMLPNTKSLYDRWLNLMRGMLILYPTCAVLMGGGRLVSRILLSSGGSNSNIWLLLVAMAAEIAPLFFVPTVVRGAYRATGALGATLNNLRGRMSHGMRNRVSNSRAFQNATARNQRRRAQSGVNMRRVNNYTRSQQRRANGTDRVIDRWRTRAGNQERVAAINEQALAAEEQQRKIDRMSDATQVAGMRSQANISTQQQNVRNADYADANFASAVITQAQIEHDASRDRQMLYNTTKYAQGKRNANDLALENEYYSTRQNADDNFIEGKRQEARLGREGERARAGLYTNAGYVDSRRNQQQAVISGEITKMYADQFSRMSMSDIMGKLNDSVAGSNVENRNEQFTAAANALIQAGQADKVREIISGDKPEYADAANGFGELIKNDKSFRDRASQVLGSSGEFTFQEYAKHLGQSTVDFEGKSSDAKSFRDWANADATDSRSLAASIQTKGLDKMDKDGFAYLAQHINALKGAAPDNIAKVAASTTDAATISKLADAVSKLDATTRSNIMASTSGSQFVNMNESVRVAISGGGTAGDAAWKAKVGEALANDPQLRGRLNTAEQERYVGRPEETVSDGGGI